jgi:hypothetical protein
LSILQKKEQVMSDKMDSTSNERTNNNTMRHKYRVLTEQEKGSMVKIKDMGVDFVELLHAIGGTHLNGEGHASDELGIAQMKMEEAVMWAVKHITR